MEHESDSAFTMLLGASAGAGTSQSGSLTWFACTSSFAIARGSHLGLLGALDFIVEGGTTSLPTKHAMANRRLEEGGFSRNSNVIVSSRSRVGESDSTYKCESLGMWTPMVEIRVY